MRKRAARILDAFMLPQMYLTERALSHYRSIGRGVRMHRCSGTAMLLHCATYPNIPSRLSPRARRNDGHMVPASCGYHRLISRRRDHRCIRRRRGDCGPWYCVSIQIYFTCCPAVSLVSFLSQLSSSPVRFFCFIFLFLFLHTGTLLAKFLAVRRSRCRRHGRDFCSGPSGGQSVRACILSLSQVVTFV